MRFSLRFPVVVLSLGAAFSEGEDAAAISLPDRWEYTAPLIEPENREIDRSHAQKDPTVVFHDGLWHVFMTVKLEGRSAIEYCSFAEWTEANAAERTLLEVSDSDYFCAPQVFYFAPQSKWYLVYQVGVPGQEMMWVAYSTTETIEDPSSWTPAQPILDGGENDPRVKGGIDYWIICDEDRAYLFFTTFDKRLWRTSTSLADFPSGFGECEVALKADFFEAAHIYRLQGKDKYLALIEQNGKRYFQAFLADRLDGEWFPLADTEDRPFAGAANIAPASGVEPWTDNVSHGELVRAGIDQTLTVDPTDLQFVFQGMFEKEKQGKEYGRFPWRIGILRPGKSQ